MTVKSAVGLARSRGLSWIQGRLGGCEEETARLSNMKSSSFRVPFTWHSSYTVTSPQF